MAAAAGLRIGLFGPLQSWPPQPVGDGFYVPDTFAKTAAAIPPSLEPFQEFNLRMTSGQRPDAVAAVPKDMLPKLALLLLRNGLTARSARRLVGQLAAERRDPDVRARRSTMQALLCFDLFHRQLVRRSPDLAIFFTNHVAGMMHRFWGDALPGYADDQAYSPDAKQAAYLETAMTYADEQLGALRRRVDASGNDVLVVLSGMGQAPLEYVPPAPAYVIEDDAKLQQQLRLPRFERGLAMHPHVSLEFADETIAIAAEQVLASVRGPDVTDMFGFFSRRGRTVSFITQGTTAHHGVRSPLTFVATDGSEHGTTPEQLGIGVRHRLGGSNTGQHDVRGSMLAYGAGVPADRGRTEVDVLDVAPSLLENLLGVPAAPSMRGRPSLWRSRQAASR